MLLPRSLPELAADCGGEGCHAARTLQVRLDPRTTKLYDRRRQQATHSEVERIRYERKQAKRASWMGIAIDRIEGGRIVEEGVSWDLFGLMQQLGAIT